MWARTVTLIVRRKPHPAHGNGNYRTAARITLHRMMGTDSERIVGLYFEKGAADPSRRTLKD